MDQERYGGAQLARQTAEGPGSGYPQAQRQTLSERPPGELDRLAGAFAGCNGSIEHCLDRLAGIVGRVGFQLGSAPSPPTSDTAPPGAVGQLGQQNERLRRNVATLESLIDTLDNL
jgi:hypothetical protein